MDSSEPASLPIAIAEAKASSRPSWRTIAMLCVGAFATALNVTMLSPLLPAIGAHFHVSDAATGQLVTATALTSGLTALIGAPWMDRWSRRTWLRAECSILLAGTLMTALAPGFGWMFVGRIAAGIGGSVIFANCMVAAADLYPDRKERNRVIGLLSTMATLGSVLGLPALAQLDAWVGWRLAIASLAIPTVIVLFGSGALPSHARSSPAPLFRGWWSGYRKVLAQRETVWLLGALIALMVIWFGWIVYFGDFAKHVHRVGANGLSALFLISGAAEVAASNATPVLMRRLPARRLGLAAVALAAVNLLAVGVVWRNAWSLAPFMAISSATMMTAFLCTSILLLDSYPEGRGSVMSLQSAGLEVGGALGAAGFGAALTVFGGYEASYRTLGLVAPLVIFGLYASARRRWSPPLPAPA